MKDMLRIGVVGVGMIGRTHIERINNTLQGGEVTGCADYSLEFAQKVADQYGIKAYATGEEMIASDEIDAIVIAASDPFHKQYVLASIAAGKYVFCEKPLAPTPEECREIVEAEIKGGKQLVQVGFMRRYDPGYIQLKEAIESGKYGAPLMLHCAHRNAQVLDSWTTQDSISNSLVHEIDVLRWLLGENYVKAEVAFPRSTKFAKEGVKDPQIMYLTTESGVRIDVESFVCNQQFYDIKCEVVCELGVLNLPKPATIEVLSDAVRGNAIDKDWSTRFVEAYNVEFQNWINASKEGSVDGPTAWDGYCAQVAVAAAGRARDSQTPQQVVYDEKPSFYN